ncbi:hypothetical protein P389DRAFT_7744 [Cystobasidium minutum MCA 4210]|uniref:uncharacterized protein n=1 Tax=Cystobasidium minutum MCA 4210 TaxID=1397322 RepID=UPI0034CF93A0|eukprot:jgi/Rhomi1/7744/CE7743_412
MRIFVTCALSGIAVPIASGICTVHDSFVSFNVSKMLSPRSSNIPYARIDKIELRGLQSSCWPILLPSSLSIQHRLGTVYLTIISSGLLTMRNRVSSQLVPVPIYAYMRIFDARESTSGFNT